MKLADVAVWTVAIVVGMIAYLCVTMAAFVIWPPAGEFMLFLLVIPPFIPETWWLIIELYRRRMRREQAQQN
jgi:hypothetical protein